MNAAITAEAVIQFVASKAQAGATSKDIAKHFHVTAKLINRKASPEHIQFEPNWVGVYSIPGLTHTEFRHYAVAQPVAVAPQVQQDIPPAYEPREPAYVAPVPEPEPVPAAPVPEPEPVPAAPAPAVVRARVRPVARARNA